MQIWTHYHPLIISHNQLSIICIRIPELKSALPTVNPALLYALYTMVGRCQQAVPYHPTPSTQNRYGYGT